MNSTSRPPAPLFRHCAHDRLLGGQFRPHLAERGLQSALQLGIQTTALGTPTVQKDALGNTFLANTIYDPSTRGVVSPHWFGLRDTVYEQPNPRDSL